MPSPKLSFRVSPETYKTLVTLAQLERKTVTEMTRDLIERGLDKQQTVEDDMLSELRMLRMELGDLMSRAMKVGGITSYYARLAAIYAQDSAYFTVNDGKTMKKEEKKELGDKWRKEAREQAMRMLLSKFEEI